MIASFSSLSAQTFSAAERGIAGYYADYLEGQPTAYGEIYHRDEMTAAHRSHPLGTLLKVTRLDTKRSVIVRVNDRGAFCDGCVISLSKVAALQLDMIKTGKAQVALEMVGYQQPAGAVAQNGAALSQRSATSAAANRHSSYPRPSATLPAGNAGAPAPSAYGDQQPVRIASAPPATVTAPAADQQARGLNAYEQINAFDSYNYYKAQEVSGQGRGNTGSTVQSDKATYERLRARGLLPETPVADNDDSFYARGGLARPDSYEQNAEPVVNTKSGANPRAYIRYNNTPTSTAPSELYSTETSFPTSYRLETPSSAAPQGNYAIQLASYRNLDNAQRQVQKLKDLGLSDAYLLETSNSGGALYKVLNGPFNDKETAMNALSRYKRDLLLDGIVILLR